MNTFDGDHCPVALFTDVYADAVSPWTDGQDLEQFYGQYCSAPDFDKHYVPSLETKQKRCIDHGKAVRNLPIMIRALPDLKFVE